VPADRRTLGREVLLVFAVSLGRSGVYAVLYLVSALSSGAKLSSVAAGLNNSQASQHWLDLIYQLVGIAFGLVPVLLMLHFLVIGGERPSKVLGIDRTQPGRDIGLGVLLAALVGGIGLGLYIIAFRMGISLHIVASGLPKVWWRIPVLLLAAAYNAILEETLVVGYLLHRLDQMGWRKGTALATSAVVRGSYHLYQGIGAFLGNAAMGVLFGWIYQRRGRTAPLIVAHFLMDAVAFVGYALLAGKVSWLP
jgi:membrane protease YdiL (CAAX protease family)